jgi:hypothetical protein
MQLDQFREQLTADIASLQQMIADRKAQIEELDEANRTALERIAQLREAETAIETAMALLDDIGPLGGAAGVSKKPVRRGPPSCGDRAPRGQLSQTVMLMLATAGASGMTIEEIAQHYEREHHRELNPSSVRSYLYQAAHEGLTERQEDGTWRLRSRDQELEAAE